MARSRHAPTEETRRLVRTLTAFGIPQESIASEVGIDPKTLRKHYKAEVSLGAHQANAKVAGSLFKAATEDGNVTAQIFWLKSRAGWTERQVVETTNKSDVTLEVPSGIPVKLVSDSIDLEQI